MTIKVDPDWWKSLFDEVYLVTDARSVCDKEITQREVDLVCELLGVSPNHRILDLCGGHGRHSLELCARGMGNCTLVDYSHYLIDHARSFAAESGFTLECLREDARSTGLPDAAFDRVIVMGNSLGYLVDADADRAILFEANRVLRSEGWLLVDVVDGKQAKSSFRPNAWHEIGSDTVVCRQREIQDDRVCARELVVSKRSGLVRDRSYSIKLYDEQEIVTLMEETGFKQVQAHTGFSFHRLRGDYGFMNCRIIATGRKP